MHEFPNVEKCYAIRNHANDPTFRNFFWTAWSRAEFENHRTLTGNPVPGVLLGREKEKLLNGKTYRLGAECLWIPVANYLKPKRLYLCGVWGRYVIDFVRQALPETKVVLHCHPASRGHYFWKKRVVTTGMIMLLPQLLGIPELVKQRVNFRFEDSPIKRESSLSPESKLLLTEKT